MVGDGGEVRIELSDNNGMDWKDVARIDNTGVREIDLKKFVYRRYDYRLRFTLKGKGTGFDALKLSHDIQHSQRPLPALGAGENTITFSAGPRESTVTIEANAAADHKGKQLTYKDWHSQLDGLKDNLAVNGREGSLTVPITTPGDMTALRLCACYRTWGDDDTWNLDVSYDDGKTWKKAGEGPGQNRGRQAYLVVKDVPAGTRDAKVRFTGKSLAGNMLGSFRVDADYTDPSFGFRPVKVTYVWSENGEEKRDEHVARKPDETYKITCAAKPVMKSLTVELIQ